MPPEHQWIVPVLIAIGTAVVVPSMIKIISAIADARRAQRDADIMEIVRRTTDGQIVAIEEANERRHVENKTLMQDIRLEGVRREGTIVARLEVLKEDLQRESDARIIETRTLNSHVMDLLKLHSANRRSSDS